MSSQIINYYLGLIFGRDRYKNDGRLRYKAIHLENSPDSYDKMTVYLIGSKKQLWHAEMVCPCSCGAVLKMNLQNDMRPLWRISENRNKVVSFYPSVRRKVGCKSHFILRHGLVHWCRDDEEDESF